MAARLFYATIAICLLATGIATAQTGLRSASLPDRTPMDPIPAPRTDQFLARPDTFAPRFDRLPARHRRRGHLPFAALPLGYGSVGDAAVPLEPRRATIRLTNGFLHLQLQPSTAQVHVDGLYMGTVDDFRRLIPGRALEPGPHRVELRASGYETITFDVQILPNETVTYREDLPVHSVSETGPVSAPAPPKTFYVVPGCYAGDRPPRPSQLRPGCDAAKLRTIPPLVSAAARHQG